MKLRRKVAALVLIGTTFVCGETRRALAQDSPPDLRMLMDLDLFEPRNNGAGAAASGAAPGDDSMLDQIRTLDAMGYLGNHRDAANGNGAPAPAAAMEAPESTPAPESAGAPPQSDINENENEPVEPPQPASRPSYDVEGPQP